MGKRRVIKQSVLLEVLAVLLGLEALCILSGPRGAFGKQTVRVGVAVYNGEDAFINKICAHLNEIMYEYEQEHPDVKIEWDIADAEGSQQEQNVQIDRYISLEYDLLLVNIVDRTNAAMMIDKASAEGVPLVFFNREPVREDIFRSEGVYYEGSNAKQSALLQADLIAESMKKNPDSIDRNGDGVIKFALLEGESGHQDTLVRSEWVLKGLEYHGIKTEKVVSGVANWERNQASVIVSQWIESYGDTLELIISNNDDMALGATDALEEKQCDTIQVVGIDGVEEVEQMVEEGRILGTVLCDTQLHAEALFEFIEALTIKPEKLDQLPLEEGRYYMIPLSTIVRDDDEK